MQTTTSEHWTEASREVAKETVKVQLRKQADKENFKGYAFITKERSSCDRN